MPTRQQIKMLMSNSKAQEYFIDMLYELLKMTEKPACPPGIPPQFCSQFIQGGIPNEWTLNVDQVDSLGYHWLTYGIYTKQLMQKATDLIFQ